MAQGTVKRREGLLTALVLIVWLLQYSCLVSQLARKTQSGMEEIDPEEELVSIWAKSGTKEVSSLDM